MAVGTHGKSALLRRRSFVQDTFAIFVPYVVLSQEMEVERLNVLFCFAPGREKVNLSAFVKLWR